MPSRRWAFERGTDAFWVGTIPVRVFKVGSGVCLGGRILSGRGQTAVPIDASFKDVRGGAVPEVREMAGGKQGRRLFERRKGPQRPRETVWA